MENSLLIGNGLNRTLKSSISWSALLQDIAKSYGVSYEANIPMPLEFERIVNTILATDPGPTTEIYTQIKTEIAKKILSAVLPDGAIHFMLPHMSVDAILTTNYDYFLEYAYNRKFVYRGKKRNKYLWNATSIQSNVKFYHLHGMADIPLSICLGYEHYMGIVENLRSELNTKAEGNPDNMKIKQVILGEKEPSDSWGERFYTNNIAIIGLGLTSAEVDIWWLLTHRAFLYYSNYCGLRERLKNRIVYYDVIDDTNIHDHNTESEHLRSMKEKENIHKLLEGAHVMVQKYYLSKYQNQYELAYRQILNDINSSFLNDR